MAADADANLTLLEVEDRSNRYPGGPASSTRTTLCGVADRTREGSGAGKRRLSLGVAARGNRHWRLQHAPMVL